MAINCKKLDQKKKLISSIEILKLQFMKEGEFK